MERPWKLKLKSKSLNFLPKTATPATFLDYPTSPVRSPTRRGFTIVSLVPKEARRRSKNGSFDWREPTSPKVSCMGQVSRKSKNNNKNKTNMGSSPQKASSSSCLSSPRKQMVMIGKILKGSKSGKKCKDEDGVSTPHVIVSPPPSLGQMKQFESGRGGALRHFDWRDAASDDDDDKAVLPNLEAIDGIVKSKEVNLWRRRSMTMAPPPPPLQI